MLDFFKMNIPLPELHKTLSVSIEDKTYECEVLISAVPIFNYYALILSYEMEKSFFKDFEIAEAFLNQYFPVENRTSALSNLKALKTNDAWLIEQANKAMKDAEFEFEIEKDDDEEEGGLDINDLMDFLSE